MIVPLTCFDSQPPGFDFSMIEELWELTKIAGEKVSLSDKPGWLYHGEIKGVVVVGPSCL